MIQYSFYTDVVHNRNKWWHSLVAKRNQISSNFSYSNKQLRRSFGCCGCCWALFWAAINSESVFLVRFHLLTPFHVILSIMTLACHPKCPYSFFFPFMFLQIPVIVFACAIFLLAIICCCNQPLIALKCILFEILIYHVPIFLKDSECSSPSFLQHNAHIIFKKYSSVYLLALTG